MDIARAFTTKRVKRPDVSLPMPQRSASTRHHGSPPVQRSKISGPVQLISTTNMLSFNAPDIHSASSSTHSPGGDSDASHPFFSTPGTSPDGSSSGSRAGSPEPNHLSTYFQTDTGRTSGSINSTRQSSSSAEDAPAVPHRALSHTAATHKALARKRSVSRVAPPSSIHGSQAHVADAGGDHGGSLHPFSRELEQVNELAEEFGVQDSMVDEEEQILMRKGLKKFPAQDYVLEIQGLFGGVFEDRLLPLGSGWI
ncbi:MAG: hypothetical protein M1837_007284 [Sclerophora amabilis]|nr:MAG: hypothetical protein M1837_007284 [Sclerophora amabilis]